MPLPFERLLEAGRGALAWLLELVGLEGVVSVSLLITVAMLFYWGYRVAWLLRLGRRVASGALRHGLVTSIVLVAVLGGGLYYGVIPAINLDPLLRALPGVVG